MSRWERFPKAPIVEALLDFQVRFKAPVELARLEAFHDLIRQQYPSRHDRLRLSASIRLEQEGVQQAVRRRPIGFIFKSLTGQTSVQVRQDGFTFNWLKPYETWEALRDEALAHWRRYAEEFQPDAVIRIGLRYINRIELPTTSS